MNCLIGLSFDVRRNFEALIKALSDGGQESLNILITKNRFDKKIVVAADGEILSANEINLKKKKILKEVVDALKI